MPAFSHRLGPPVLVARVAALVVLASGLMEAVPVVVAYDWVHPLLVISAIALALAVLILPVFNTELRTVIVEPASSPPLNPALSETPQDTLRDNQLAATFEKARHVADELEGYSFFTRLLRNQAEVVSNITENASTAILARLWDVDKVTSALLAFIEQSGSNEGVTAIVERLGQQMAANQVMVKQFEAQRAQDLAASERDQEEIRKAVAALGKMAETVRKIAHQTNMLALNATIESSRAGAAGAGFAVVAREVKALSLQSDRTALDIRKGIDQLQKTIQTSLDAIVHERVQEEDKAFGRLTTAIGDLAENMELLIGHQRDVLTKVRGESVHIAKAIMDLMSEVQFQDITRQQLGSLSQTSEVVDSHLTDLRRVLSDLAVDIDCGRFLETMRETYDNYVMASQRASHSAASGQTVTEAAGPKIELF